MMITRGRIPSNFRVIEMSKHRDVDPTAELYGKVRDLQEMIDEGNI